MDGNAVTGSRLVPFSVICASNGEVTSPPGIRLSGDNFLPVNSDLNFPPYNAAKMPYEIWWAVCRGEFKKYTRLP
jgi:hypothetical protein